MDLDYKLDERRSIPVMKLAGRFDAEAAAFVKGQISNLVNEQQPNLVIDMSQVTFVDSLALAALVSGLKLCRKNRGVLKLVGLQPGVRLLFEITRLDQAFELHDNTDSAFAAFSQG
jgi:anti-sigma B factor antagonist